MVSATFQRLPAEKKQRVDDALLAEFSAHSLAEAQVARIVKEAGIARGAFYSYFTDLPDAYAYVFKQVMQAVHKDLPPERDYYQATANFVQGTQNSHYRQFLRQHFTSNSGMFGQTPSKLPQSASAWAAMVLCHETIRDCLRAPDQTTARLALLQAALVKLQQ